MQLDFQADPLWVGNGSRTLGCPTVFALPTVGGSAPQLFYHCSCQWAPIHYWPVKMIFKLFPWNCLHKLLLPQLWLTAFGTPDRVNIPVNDEHRGNSRYYTICLLPAKVPSMSAILELNNKMI